MLGRVSARAGVSGVARARTEGETSMSLTYDSGFWMMHVVQYVI